MQVFGVSLDPPEDNQRFREEQGYSFRLLSDVDRSMSLSFGAVAHPKNKYAKRLTFVIGPDGLIEQSIVTSDLPGQAANLLECW